MRKVKTDRSLLIYNLLTIVTCGIYAYFFIHDLAQDVNEMCKDDGKTTQGLLVYILLSIVTCGIYGIIWWYCVADRVGYTAARRFGKLDFNGGVYLLWTLLGCFVCAFLPFVGMYKLIECTNAVAAHYNQMIDTAYANGGQIPYTQPQFGQPNQFYGNQQQNNPYNNNNPQA